MPIDMDFDEAEGGLVSKAEEIVLEYEKIKKEESVLIGSSTSQLLKFSLFALLYSFTKTSNPLVEVSKPLLFPLPGRVPHCQGHSKQSLLVE